MKAKAHTMNYIKLVSKTTKGDSDASQGIIAAEFPLLDDPYIIGIVLYREFTVF